MTSSRRQVLVGSLALATAFFSSSVHSGQAFAAEASPQRVIDAMGAVRTTQKKVAQKLDELAAKQGEVVMKAELSPLSASLGEMVQARDHLVTVWRKWSQGKHKDVDDKLTTLASKLGVYKTAVANIPGGGILTAAMVTELRTHDDAVRELTVQVGDRIDELTG